MRTPRFLTGGKRLVKGFFGEISGEFPGNAPTFAIMVRIGAELGEVGVGGDWIRVSAVVWVPRFAQFPDFEPGSLAGWLIDDLQGVVAVPANRPIRTK